MAVGGGVNFSLWDSHRQFALTTMQVKCLSLSSVGDAVRGNSRGTVGKNSHCGEEVRKWWKAVSKIYYINE